MLLQNGLSPIAYGLLPEDAHKLWTSVLLKCRRVYIYIMLSSNNKHFCTIFLMQAAIKCAGPKKESA